VSIILQMTISHPAGRPTSRRNVVHLVGVKIFRLWKVFALPLTINTIRPSLSGIVSIINFKSSIPLPLPLLFSLVQSVSLLVVVAQISVVKNQPQFQPLFPIASGLRLHVRRTLSSSSCLPLLSSILLCPPQPLPPPLPRTIHLLFRVDFHDFTLLAIPSILAPFPSSFSRSSSSLTFSSLSRHSLVSVTQQPSLAEPDQQIHTSFNHH
jgi:hypothetical protein